MPIALHPAARIAWRLGSFACRPDRQSRAQAVRFAVPHVLAFGSGGSCAS
jgi:hypothetical protein